VSGMSGRGWLKGVVLGFAVPVIALSVAAVVHAASVASGQTIVSLTFDDGRASQVDAAAALNARGLDGTFYVNSSDIGASASLTLAELHSIAAAGHEIGGHSTYHYDIPEQDSLDEQRRQICGDRNWLLAQGFSPVSYAYPYSHWSTATEAIVAECGYTSGRQGWMLDPLPCQSSPCAETIPPADPFAIRTPETVSTDTTLVDLKAMVTSAEQTGGGWVPIMFHDVCSNCGYYAVTPSILAAFLDWLKARESQGTVVETVSDVMGNPAVAGPGPYPSPPTPDPANLLQNPGLETAGPGWILPYQVPVRCWQEWGDWSATATWTRTSDAHSGSSAMNISLAANDSYGYHAMVPTLDLGACAPSVTAGQAPTFTGWYKSDTPVDVFQLVRGAEKRWRVLAGTVTLSPSSSWRTFSVTLPPMPGDATGVAPGFAFTHAGSFTVDDLKLTSSAQSTSTLSVTPAGMGSGTVTSSPSGITCGSTCTSSFAQGTTVTLTATPNAGSTFSGWAGACSGTGPCVLAMNTDRAVTATFAGSVPVAPSGLSAVAGSASSVVLGWVDNATNESGYTVERSLTSGFVSVTSVALAANATSYTDTGLSASTTYFYRVRASNATGPSGYSNVASATTLAAGSVPVAPSGLSAVAGSASSVVLGWVDNATNESGYTVERSLTSGFVSVTSVALAANATSYTDTGLSASTTYFYRVRASNATGPSGYSNVASATTQAAGASGYAATVLADGPSSYWRLGETSGTAVVDQKAANSGFYFNGVVLGAASLLGQDAANAACTFDGVNDFANIYNSASLSPTAAVTLEAWIKPASLPAVGASRSIVSKVGAYSLQLSGPLLEFSIVQSGVVRAVQAASGAIQVGGTYHLVGTYDGTTQRLYINGVQVASVARSGAISSSGNSLTIGSFGGSNYFQGTIDEVAVYSSALTATRITNHYTAGA
jgi:peptidoglycan/xylan/chitin deacetylase (PgdA/CDA1 family)